MNRRDFILAISAALGTTPVLPAMAQQQRATLTELSAYVDGIASVTARFTQINADGTQSAGLVSIRRPGRARFEYDPPNQDALVVAGGGQLAVFDGRASGQPQQFPLSRTPLALILARNVDLTRASMITGIGTHRNMTIVEAQDRDHPEYGTIRLYFETDPIRLAEWVITAQSGEQTRTILDPFEARTDLPNTLFDIGLIARTR
ncbi:MAG: LolA family protein [Qingshengfaniella sp.]